MNKKAKPKDVIVALQRPASKEGGLERSFRKIANISKNFHKSLQNKDTPIDLGLHGFQMEKVS